MDVFISLQNVNVEAPPAEGGSLEATKAENVAQSLTTERDGGCSRTACCASSLLWERMLKEQPWAEAEAKVIDADDEVLNYILDNGRGFPSEITQIQLCRNIQKLVEEMEGQQKSKNPEHLENKANALKELLDSMGHPSYIVNRRLDS